MIQTARRRYKSGQQQFAVEDVKKAMGTDANVSQDYVVDRTTSHGDTPHGRRYVVSWYEYGAIDDSLDQSHQVPKALYQAILKSSYKKSQRKGCN